MAELGWIARESPDGARSVTSADGSSSFAFHPELGFTAATDGANLVPAEVMEWLMYRLFSSEDL